MEALLAFMAVMLVLAAYLGVVAAFSMKAADPTGLLDEDEFGGTIEDGVFVPSFTGYLGEFIDVSGCSGISVSVLIPGGFCAIPEPVSAGSLDGLLHSRTFVSEVSDGAGRIVPAVFEVVVCA